MLKSILFIVNKAAGTDEKKRFPQQVKKVLDSRAFSSQVVFTEYPGHATILARQAVEARTDIIAAVGGDGSVNEVARALMGTGAVLAVIPKGSGNGFARALNIPVDTAAALSVIRRDKAVAIDVGYAGQHLFLSNAGIGFDALIAELFSGRKKRGLINYGRLVVRAINQYSPGIYHLSTDEEDREEKALFVAVANGNQFGYNFKIAPDARMDDGLLDICVMKPLRWWHLPLVMISGFSGKLAGSPWMKHIRTARISIRSADSLKRIQVDGEALPWEAADISMQVSARALRVLVP